MWAVHSLETAGQRRRDKLPASSPLAAGLRLLLGQLELLAVGQLAGWSNQLNQLNHWLFGQEPHRQQQQQLERQADF